MFIATLALVVAGFQNLPADERLDAKLTARIDASSLQQVAHVLGKKAGLNLSGDDRLASQVAIVDVHEARLRDVMDRLATVTDTEWVKNGDGYLLRQSAPKRQERAQAEYALRLSQIQKALDKYREIASQGYQATNLANYIREQNRQQQNGDQGMGRFMEAPTADPSKEYGAFLPTGRALARALLSIDPSVPASLTSDQRIVFSTNPTKMQRSLPIDVKKEAASFAADLAVAREAYKTVSKDAPAGERGDGEGMDEAADPGGDFAPARFRLVLSRTPQFFGSDTITALWSALEKDGNEVYQQQSTLWTDSFLSQSMLGIDFDPTEAPVQFDARPDSIWHIKALMGVMRDENYKKDPRFNTIMLHPDAVEPLSLLTSDLLADVAKKGGLNLIAELSDDDIIAGIVGMTLDKDLTRAREKLESTLFDDLSQNDGWLMMRPKFAASRRSSQVNRKALGTMIRSVGTPSLSELARYASDRGVGPQMNLIELAYLLGVRSDSAGSFMSGLDTLDSPALKFIGGLDNAGMSAFLAGVPRTYSSMTPSQKSLMDEFVYGCAGQNLRSSDAPGENEVDPEVSEEVTDLLPNGIPAGGTARMIHQDRPTLFQPSPDGKSWMPVDQYSVALQIAAKTRPELLKDAQQFKPVTQFRIGGTRGYIFQFWVTAKTYYSWSFDQRVMPEGSSTLTYDQVPAELKRSIEDLARQLVTTPSGGYEDDGG